MADQAEQVLKDAAYFDELRRAVGRAVPTALPGTSSFARDRSIDSLEELELQKRPDVYSEYNSIAQDVLNGQRRLWVRVGNIALLALGILFALIGPVWLAFFFFAGGYIIAGLGPQVLNRIERRTLR